MNKIEQIKYFKGFMPLEITKIINDYCKRYDESFVEYGNSEKEFSINAFKSNEYESRIIRSLVLEWNKKVYRLVMENYHESFDSFDMGGAHIAKFDPGWGMHEHFDVSKPNDIATIIYINDDYFGGEIYFPDYDISYKPSAGDLIMFPDNQDYVHGVKEIGGSQRYTIPRWFTRIV
jgi:hypothetical protein